MDVFLPGVLEGLQGRVVDVGRLEGGAGDGGLEVHRLHLGVELHEDGLDAVGDDVAGVVDVVQVLAEGPRQNVVVVLLMMVEGRSNDGCNAVVGHHQRYQESWSWAMFGFLYSSFWSSLAYESAKQKPKHCLTPGFLIPLKITKLRMASQTQGIQQLLSAEKRAAEKGGNSIETFLA